MRESDREEDRERKREREREKIYREKREKRDYDLARRLQEETRQETDSHGKPLMTCWLIGVDEDKGLAEKLKSTLLDIQISNGEGNNYLIAQGGA